MGEFGNQPYNPKWQHPIFIAMYNAKRRGDTDMDTILLSTLYQLFGPPNTETCLKILDVPLVDTRSLFPYMTDEEYSFMMLFLKINPKERPSFQQIFDHSYLNGYMPTEPSNMSSLNKIKIYGLAQYSTILKKEIKQEQINRMDHQVPHQ